MRLERSSTRANRRSTVSEIFRSVSRLIATHRLESSHHSSPTYLERMPSTRLFPSVLLRIVAFRSRCATRQQFLFAKSLATAVDRARNRDAVNQLADPPTDHSSLRIAIASTHAHLPMTSFQLPFPYGCVCGMHVASRKTYPAGRGYMLCRSADTKLAAGTRCVVSTEMDSSSGAIGGEGRLTIYAAVSRPIDASNRHRYHCD